MASRLGINWRFTSRADGDLSIAGDADQLAQRRSAIVEEPWCWLHQVHSATVLRAAQPSDACGQDGDALVSDRAGLVLAVHGADCAPVLFWGDNGSIGAAHAGWRGLTGGVLEAVVEELRAGGAREIGAVLGPCIHSECYEFGPLELQLAVERLGPQVAGLASNGRPALDLVAGVTTALAGVGVALDSSSSRCTACHEDLYSWRARRDVGRLAGLIWRDRP